MSQQVRAWKRSFDRWSPEETDVLIKEWAPLYMRGRARSSRALVTKDWRAVAEAVNSYRIDTAGLSSRRTHSQCKSRMEHLRRQYDKGLAPQLGWPFFSALDAVWAVEVGDRGAGAVEGRGAPAGDAGGAAAATAALEVFVPGLPAGDASGCSAMKVPDGAVVIVDARGGAFVHEDCRAVTVAVNSSRTTGGGGSSERARSQCKGHVKPLSDIYEKKPEVLCLCAAAVNEERGGSSIDGRGAAAEAAPRRATFVPPPIPKRPRSGAAKPAANIAVDDEKPAEANVADLYAQALATGSVDAAVLMKLAETYKELRMKVLDVEREKAAAAHAAAGHRAFRFSYPSCACHTFGIRKATACSN